MILDPLPLTRRPGGTQYDGERDGKDWGYRKMHVVSENSETDLARKRAMGVVDWSLRQLTANVIRVARGAGKAYEIPLQAQEFIDALVGFREAVGHFPSDYELAACITIEPTQELHDRLSLENRQEMGTERQIIRGALQITASHLLGQAAQKSAGGNEMLDGIRNMETFRAERQKAWEAEVRARAVGQVRRRRKPKKPGSPAE
jgi:hypothetical protein